MSATNYTTTIELSQYISTDKPTYLTDYNGDMLKIDNAIAADRDSISTAQNKANTADGKADANKLSIDTLNAQINGDTSDPSDTGLAGKVTGIDGEVDTIEALIGNGTPTTSNQTIIGAINGLEGAIAPREDGADLANSYAIGEQFARGGSVYTALTSLTAGTAFASLTLNTDYKNSDTLVEQIADIKGDIPTLPFIFSDIHFELAKVTADGVKTVSELMSDLHDALVTAVGALEDNETVEVVEFYGDLTDPMNLGCNGSRIWTNASTPNVQFSSAYGGSTIPIRVASCTGTNHSLFVVNVASDNTVTYIDNSAVVPTSGKYAAIYVRKYISIA